MYIQHTYQDWEQVPDDDRPALALSIIKQYKASLDFSIALMANEYFEGNNTEISKKVMLQVDSVKVRGEDGETLKKAVTKTVEGNRIPGGFLFRFVCQQNQFLLSNGVQLRDDNDDGGEKVKAKLGTCFDKALEELGERALLHGVAWGFWNMKQLEVIEAVKDNLSGFVALLDEVSGCPRVGIQFWQLEEKRPLYFRLFEHDGVTIYKVSEGNEPAIYTQKQAYQVSGIKSGSGEWSKKGRNHSTFPIIPLYANNERRSELTPAIKRKIDLYDRILSDFGDNLDRANDVYWVLNNFGGNTDEVVQMLTEINKIKAVINQTDGATNATAEPHTIQVPYEARQTALKILHKGLYEDYMALDMNEITGGSLTNVAIEAAMANLNLKANRYEWQCFKFIQQVLALQGIETEDISFQRQTIANASEIVQDIYLMRSDIDRETALRLNPYVMQDEIPAILENLDAEETTGVSSMEALQRKIDGMNAESKAAQTGGET